MNEIEVYIDRIREWEYCYCRSCERIRYSSELEATIQGIRCSRCLDYSLEAPAWVQCPHDKGGAVKCPRAGGGIIKEEHRLACIYRCSFRRG